MAGWKDFQEIVAWQYARDLKLRVDEYLERPHVKKRYRLYDQLYDAVRSGPSNLAEGFGKYGNEEFARYARIAKGSEVEEPGTLGTAAERRPWNPWNLWNLWNPVNGP